MKKWMKYSLIIILGMISLYFIDRHFLMKYRIMKYHTWIYSGDDHKFNDFIFTDYIEYDRNTIIFDATCKQRALDVKFVFMGFLIVKDPETGKIDYYITKSTSRR